MHSSKTTAYGRQHNRLSLQDDEDFTRINNRSYSVHLSLNSNYRLYFSDCPSDKQKNAIEIKLNRLYLQLYM